MTGQTQDSQSEETDQPIENGNGKKPLSKRIFEDPSIQLAKEEDPLFIFFQKWWRHLLIAAAVIFAYQYGSSKFQQTYESSMKKSSELFSRVQNEFEELKRLAGELEANKLELEELKAKSSTETASAEDKSDEEEAAVNEEGSDNEEQIQNVEVKLSEAQKNFNESRRKLGQYLNALDDAKEPYSELATLYRGLAVHIYEDLDTMRATLSEFNWSEVTELDSSERLIAELAAVSLARAMLEEEATLNEGKQMLTKLARNGHYVHVSSAVSLARVSKTPEDKQEASSVIESILERQPEQLDLLEPELERLKG